MPVVACLAALAASPPRRKWMARDLDLAARWRSHGVPVAEVARRLSRTPAAVVNALCYYRRNLRTRTPFTSAVAAKLRRLHARGLSDAQVGFNLDVSRERARQWRNRLGLPPDVRRYDWKARYRRQMEKAGAASLAELRHRPKAAGEDG
jgi:hypothetical protein